ncbi:MAG: acetyl-CoA carboxylase biotin carboxyl carrier protein subunit [Caulobacteraceae bacterium]
MISDLAVKLGGALPYEGACDCEILVEREGTWENRAMALRTVRSELNAQVWKIEVAPGAVVAKDQSLILLECMKTEIPVVSPCVGRVANILVRESETVKERQALLTIEDVS